MQAAEISSLASRSMSLLQACREIQGWGVCVRTGKHVSPCVLEHEGRRPLLMAVVGGPLTFPQPETVPEVSYLGE